MAAEPSASCLLEEPDRLQQNGKDNEEEEEEVVREARDWAALPRDVLLDVFSRLDHVDILTGRDIVCSPWRRACVDEPDLWRRVHMRFHCYTFNHWEYLEMVRAAMRRSAGRCEAFWAEGYVTERILSLLAYGAPSLKSLRLIYCRDIADMALKPLITKFPMLEELELSNCLHNFPDTLEAVGDACPLLKRFRLSQISFYSEYKDDRAAMAIAKMLELRSLQLTANSLTNNGLKAILDGCPHLESLDIRNCYHVCMNGDMQAKCVR